MPWPHTAAKQSDASRPAEVPAAVCNQLIKGQNMACLSPPMQSGQEVASELRVRVV